LVAEFEAAPCKHDKFAARHKLNVDTFRQWLYRLRAEKPAASRKTALRFVEVVAPKNERGCTLAMGGIELRFEGLPPPEYLAELLSRTGR
jgi:hypothetical protein